MHDRNPEIRTDIPFRLDQLLFDTVGRKMIAGTFALGGALLFATANLFGKGMLTATTQTMAWSAIFFFAFAASSSAYLTASEIFPLETRALAIACFYALGTAIGGSLSPALFGRLIESESAWYVSFGYMIAALLMLFTDSSTGWLQVFAPERDTRSEVESYRLRLRGCGCEHSENLRLPSGDYFSLSSKEAFISNKASLSGGRSSFTAFQIIWPSTR
jgi:MFS family permease